MEPVSDLNGLLDDPDAPWGGFKYSGVGRDSAGTGSRHFWNHGPSSSDRSCGA
jgi:acyl-CoA reductase-like NAD-dependent aldehyde dehydrogenase